MTAMSAFDAGSPDSLVVNHAANRSALRWANVLGSAAPNALAALVSLLSIAATQVDGKSPMSDPMPLSP
jgi:hypothetical protein